jgi:hypothetical protein
MQDSSDRRQTQDERPLGRDAAEDVREEYTTYLETEPDRATPEEAAARREAELQPAPTREGEAKREGAADPPQEPRRRASS